VSIEEYQSLCYKSITQYQTLLKNNSILKDFQLDEFVEKYWILNCSNAINRLHIGLPATIEHSIPNSTHDLHETLNARSTGGYNTSSNDHNNSSSSGGNKLIAEITSNFITLMDALKLDFKTKDQLHPILSDLLTNLTTFFKSSPPDIVENYKIQRQNLIDWLIKLNKMKLNDGLNDEELKTMLFDLESGYSGFYKSLR
jgi:ESCRT-I complex subunit VPS28